MRKKTVYFETGEIIEFYGGSARLKRIIQTHQRYEPCRYWFRPTDAWKKASDEYYEKHKGWWYAA